MEIRVEFSEESILGHGPGPQIDKKASLKRYGAVLESELRGEYEGEEVEVVQSDGDKVTVNGDPDHREATWIEHIAEGIRLAQGWIVEKQ